jgi:class 3 adenylate cyclase
VQHLGDRYAAFLADVRHLLRAAVRASGGREVEVRADELFAVFIRAVAALDAALAIQRNVRARAWPDGLRLRVRVGLHTGRPTLTDTGYVGLVVHTAARIGFAGHGGQILVSRPTREAVEGAQPVGVGFRDLGLHELHGLPAPELLFQVEASDLPADFPPLRTVSQQVT